MPLRTDPLTPRIGAARSVRLVYFGAAFLAAGPGASCLAVTVAALRKCSAGLLFSIAATRRLNSLRFSMADVFNASFRTPASASFSDFSTSSLGAASDRFCKPCR